METKQLIPAAEKAQVDREVIEWWINRYCHSESQRNFVRHFNNIGGEYSRKMDKRTEQRNAAFLIRLTAHPVRQEILIQGHDHAAEWANGHIDWHIMGASVSKVYVSGWSSTFDLKERTDG